MLFFANVTTDALPAITHVDGTARVQSVGPTADPPFPSLLQAQSRRTGYGVLCNTSLNFKGLGFINRSSDLFFYCERKGIATPSSRTPGTARAEPSGRLRRGASGTCSSAW